MQVYCCLSLFVRWRDFIPAE